VLARIRSHVAGNVVGYLALFVALGGTSYAVATGSVDSRAIKNNSVRGKDVRNRTLTGRDIRPDAIGGVQINEATLGPVAAAGRAGDASLLGGLPPAAFAPANQTATVDVLEGGAEKKVLTLNGLGELVVESCDASVPVALHFVWRNTGGAAQDVWAQIADTDDPSNPPSYGQLSVENPPSEFDVSLNGGAVVDTTFLIRPRSGSAKTATIQMFAALGQTDGVCRVSAQAVL
jgi:hypothetical protein